MCTYHEGRTGGSLAQFMNGKNRGPPPGQNIESTYFEEFPH